MLTHKRRATRRNRQQPGTGHSEQLEVRKVLSAVSITADVNDMESHSTNDVDMNGYYNSVAGHLSSGNAALASSAESIIVGGGVQRIVNGTETNEFKEVGIVNNGCTGTLIAPNAVLTAAHCVEPGQPSTFDLNGKTYQSSKVVVHPDYQSNDIDLAIIILDQPVEGVTPANINRTPPEVGQLLTLVGFGGTGTGNSGHNGDFGVKNVGTTPIDQVTATQVNWNFENNTESNTAPGDSGGPAYVKVDGQFYVAGVTSGGTKEDASIGDFSFDTRVDTFASWIDSVVGSDGGGGNDGGGGGGNDGGGDGTAGDNSATFTNNVAVNIPSDVASTVTSQVSATGLGGKVIDIDVKLDINHTWDGDLDVVLISPSGTRVDLFYGVGSDSDNFTNTVLDDDASQYIEEGAAPFTGEFVPLGDLNQLNGEDPNGTWTLEVSDGFEEDGGQISSFAVTITTDAVDDTGGDGGNDGGGDEGNDGNTGGNTLAELAVKTDTAHGLEFTGNDFENWGGRGEKWMTGNAGWYFITPDGSFYQWNNEPGADGTLIATFDASFHQDTALLHEAADNAGDGDVGGDAGDGNTGNSGGGDTGDLAQKAIEVDTQHDLEAAEDDYLDWGGRNEKWMVGNQGWYFMTPDGSFYQWDGSNEATGTLLATFDSQFYSDTSLLFNAADNNRAVTTRAATAQAATAYADTDMVFSSLEDDDDLFAI